MKKLTEDENNTRYKGMLDVDRERREECMKNHYYKKN